MPAPLSYLLVDGHSVMHAWPELKRHLAVASKRHLARTELLKRLRHYQDMSGCRVVVVFDGTQSQMSEEREKDGLQIIYADSGNSADHILEKLAAKYARQHPMRVVSADGMVGETVMAFGADWMSPELLKSFCDEADKQIQSHLQKLQTRRHMLAWMALGSVGFTLPACASKPAEPSLSEDALKAAEKYSATRKGHALLIRQHGRVIHESYANNAKPGEPRRIFSGTKGFWGLAALAAVEDGFITLDEPVSDTIHEWQKQPGKKDITLGQLLHFTGGIERCLKIHEDGLKNRNDMALKSRLVAPPGKAFIYGPSQLQVLHEVLKRKLKISPTRYLEKRILRPLKLGPQRYLPDASGHPLLAAGFMLTTQQWARMGDLLLHEGALILQPESFKRLREGSTANPSYSLGFWNNQSASKNNAREIDIEDMLERDWDKQSWKNACLCQDAPADMLACIGSGYQRLFVIPSLKLVIVRQGQNSKFSDHDFLRILLS